MLKIISNETVCQVLQAGKERLVLKQGEVAGASVSSFHAAKSKLDRCIVRGCNLVSGTWVNPDIDSVLFEECNFGKSLWQKGDFLESCFRASVLADAAFERCTIERCSFLNNEVVHLTAQDCEFIECAIGDRWQEAKISNCYFFNCDFSFAHFAQCTFDRCHFIECTFTGTYIEQSQFTSCTIKDGNLDFSSLVKTSFTSSKIAHCSALHTTFTEPKFENTVLTALRPHDQIQALQVQAGSVKIRRSLSGYLFGTKPGLAITMLFLVSLGAAWYGYAKLPRFASPIRLVDSLPTLLSQGKTQEAIENIATAVRKNPTYVSEQIGFISREFQKKDKIKLLLDALPGWEEWFAAVPPGQRLTVDLMLLDSYAELQNNEKILLTAERAWSGAKTKDHAALPRLMRTYGDALAKKEKYEKLSEVITEGILTLSNELALLEKFLTRTFEFDVSGDAAVMRRTALQQGCAQIASRPAYPACSLFAAVSLIGSDPAKALNNLRELASQPFDRTSLIDTEFRSRIYTALGEAHEKLGNLTAAGDAYFEAISWWPINFNYYANGIEHLKKLPPKHRNSQALLTLLQNTGKITISQFQAMRVFDLLKTIATENQQLSDYCAALSAYIEALSKSNPHAPIGAFMRMLVTAYEQNGQAAEALSTAYRALSRLAQEPEEAREAWMCCIRTRYKDHPEELATTLAKLAEFAAAAPTPEGKAAFLALADEIQGKKR